MCIRWVIIVLAGLWLPFAIGFELAGVWPVLPFLGLGLALLYGLLRWNLRASNAVEAFIAALGDFAGEVVVMQPGETRRF